MGDVRCPDGARMLFQLEDGLLVVLCSDCTKNTRRRDPEVFQVVHRYTIVLVDGEVFVKLVDTVKRWVFPDTSHPPVAV